MSDDQRADWVPFPQVEPTEEGDGIRFAWSRPHFYADIEVVRGESGGVDVEWFVGRRADGAPPEGSTDPHTLPRFVELLRAALNGGGA